MTRKLIDPALQKALLEGPKADLVEPSTETQPDLSIDSMLHRGLAAVDRLLRCITKDISTGVPSRDTVMNLRDAMAMLHTLKEKEQELLEGMSEEDLEKAASK